MIPPNAAGADTPADRSSGTSVDSYSAAFTDTNGHLPQLGRSNTSRARLKIGASNSEVNTENQALIGAQFHA